MVILIAWRLLAQPGLEDLFLPEVDYSYILCTAHSHWAVFYNGTIP